VQAERALNGLSDELDACLGYRPGSPVRIAESVLVAPPLAPRATRSSTDPLPYKEVRRRYRIAQTIICQRNRRISALEERVAELEAALDALLEAFDDGE
jgi:hypothetical protein